MTGLRPYQAELMAGIHDAWKGGARRVAAVMATGGGKTIVFSHLAGRHHPTLVIAHRTELIEQAVAKLRKVNPRAEVGRMQGPVKQWRADIVVGSVQTCSRPGALRMLAARRWGLVIVDECFPAGTPIDGRPIESVRPGDMVRTWDESTGALTVGRVVGTQSRVPLGMVRVTLDDGRSFACTPNHPLRTNFGWIAAEQAHGVSVLSFGGGHAPGSAAGFARVVRVEVLESGRDGTYGGVCPDGLVYNFEVAGTHTYLVGDERSGVVVHNCHHIAAPSYQTVLREVGCFRSDGPLLLGVTATLDRADGLSLGDTIEAVAEPRIGLMDLIRQGYLVRPRGIRVKIRDLDLDGVRKVAGDLNQGQLGAAMHAAMAPQKLVEAWIEHAKGRQTIAFMPTVAVSEEVAATFRAAGFDFRHLSDKTHPRERAATLEAYRRGEVTGLCNVGLFTEGTDLPTTECVILKMTSSSTLYQQMVGRGLRLHDPAQCECPIQPCMFHVKQDCVILDPSGVAKRHTLATLVSLAGAPAEGEVPDDLLMYEEDLEEESERDEPSEVAPIEYEDGDGLDYELVDMFGESSVTWLRTPGRVWFVPVPGGVIYIDRPGLDSEWSLRWKSEQYGDGLIVGDVSLEYAMRAGEEYIAARPMWQADRNAPWRSMRAWGSTRTKGEIADERAMVRAAQLLDS